MPSDAVAERADRQENILNGALKEWNLSYTQRAFFLKKIMKKLYLWEIQCQM